PLTDLEFLGGFPSGVVGTCYAGGGAFAQPGVSPISQGSEVVITLDS
ncbi:hypothetical protein LCGC14_2714450, partial [marine sediment metagenome]